MKRHTRKKNNWKSGGLLENIDVFGSPLPQFNIRGQEKVHTRIGGVCTLLITSVVLLFAMVKFVHLYTKHNPTMSAYYKDSDASKKINLNKLNMRIAFAVEDYILPKQLKNDPKYVRWVFRVFGRQDGKPY